MAKRKTKRQGLITLVIAAFLVVALLLLEFGTYIGLPDWRTLFAGADLSTPDTVPQGHLEVHYIDVGNADSILLLQGEQAMLIDAGERGDDDTILAYLHKRGVEKLDLVIATHPHADHIGSMADVIREVEIGQFLMTFMPEADTPTTKVYLDMLEALDEKQVPVTEVLPGDSYDLGSAKVHILAPIQKDSDPNAMSVVSYVVFGSNRFLFTGDAEKSVEEDILDAGSDIQADVLKVGHHGSSTGTTEAFLKAVNPKYAVITCGEGNSYGHPHDEVLEALESMQVKVLRSDINGTVIFHSDGQTITTSVEKGAF